MVNTSAMAKLFQKSAKHFGVTIRKSFSWHPSYRRYHTENQLNHSFSTETYEASIVHIFPYATNIWLDYDLVCILVKFLILSTTTHDVLATYDVLINFVE